MKLNELDLSSAFGNYGAAALKGGWDSLRGKGTGNLSTKDRMAKDGFIKDFVGRASANIQSAIEGGLVTAEPTPQPVAPDPVTGPTVAAPAPAAPVQAAPAATTPQAAPAATTPQASAAPASPAAGSNAFGQMARQLGGSGTSSTGGQTTASATGVKHTANPNNPNQPKPAVAPAPATPAPAAAPVADRAGAKSRAMSQQRRFNKGSAIQENYDILNQIFESIMEAGEQTTPSISPYLQKMFIQYMKGVDTSSQSARIKTLCDAVEQSYAKDGGQAALTQLANLGFALSYSNKGKDATAAPTGTSTGMGGSFVQGLTGQTPPADATGATPPEDATGATPPGDAATPPGATPPGATPPAAAKAPVDIEKIKKSYWNLDPAERAKLRTDLQAIPAAPAAPAMNEHRRRKTRYAN